MRKVLYTSLIILCITLMLSIASPAFANAPTPTPDALPLQMLQVDPVISELHLIPGQDTVIGMTIKNLASKPLGIHAQLSNFTDPQTDQVISQNVNSLDFISWTTIDSPDIILNAYQTKHISVVIHTPLHAKNSGYAEMIFLTPFVSNDVQKNSPIVLSRIGCLILGTVGKLNYDNLMQKTFISPFNPQSTIIDHGPVRFYFGIQNKYFTYFTAKPFLTVTPLFGKSQRFLLDEHHILPGNTHTWEETVSLFPIGIYLAHLAVSIGEGKQITADTYVIIFPQIILVVCCILFAALLLCIFVKSKKTRVKKALRILIKGK